MKYIVYILATLTLLYPFLNAGFYGADWGEFFTHVTVCAVISFLLFVIGNLIRRVEKLEERDKDEQ